MTTSLVVSEIFGPTFQGEGPTIGRRAMFVRLGRCNLDCVWCDTPYTWDWKGKNGMAYKYSDELHNETLTGVSDACNAQGDAIVVVTGGEPLLQRDRLVELLPKLKTQRIEFETNGTRFPGDLVKDPRAHFNVSPKLANSGVARERAIIPEVLRFLSLCRSHFKFVVSDPSDLREVEDLVARMQLSPNRVWIMPEGRSIDVLNRREKFLALAALERGYNFTTRLQVRLWGDERGH